MLSSRQKSKKYRNQVKQTQINTFQDKILALIIAQALIAYQLCWLTWQRAMIEFILLAENHANGHFLHLKVKLTFGITKIMIQI
jgi:hypothetical protein